MEKEKMDLAEKQPKEAEGAAQAVAAPLSDENGFYAEAYYEEQRKRRENRIEDFRRMGPMSIAYALFYVLCLYQNQSGLFVAFWTIGTLIYAGYAIKINQGLINKGTRFYMLAIVLLGVGVCTTGNETVQICNKLAIGFLLVCCLLHSFYQDQSWNIGKYLTAICQSIIGAVASIGAPFTGCIGFLKEHTKEKKKQQLIIYILIGVGIAIPLVAMIMVLLMSADAVFSSIFTQLFSYIQFPQHLFGIIFLLIFAFFSSYCGVTYLASRKIREEMNESRNGEPLIAIIIASTVTIVYTLFCLIQIIYLFGGKMTLPEGYTYAEYAREGFFQLLFICILNLVLVLVGMELFKKNRVLQILLTVISVCTYIMIASSAYRMLMYIDSYNLSFLRVAVLWALAALTVLLSGLVLHIYKEEIRLFPFFVTVVTLFYLGFGFSHPDYYIALYNLNHYMTVEAGEGVEFELGGMEDISEKADYSYISQLSTDAAPAIYGKHGSREFLAEDAYEWNQYYENRIRFALEGTNIRTFNFSEYIAGKCLNNR